MLNYKYLIPLVITVSSFFFLGFFLGKEEKPSINNIVNKYDKSNNQWQATIVFPSGLSNLSYDSFLYETPYREFTESSINYNKRVYDDLKSKCYYFNIQRITLMDVYVVNCFNIKK